MTTSLDLLVKPETDLQTHRSSRHKSRRRKRIALKTLLILALIIGGASIVHFAYNAHQIAFLCPSNEHDDSAFRTPGEFAGPITEDCRAAEAASEELMRWDAATALVAVMLLVGSTVVLRRLKTRRR